MEENFESALSLDPPLNSLSVKRMQVWKQTVELLVEEGCIYIPAERKDYILKVYGRQTLEDFDKLWGFNEKIGKIYPTSFQTMMHYMNMMDEDDEGFEQQMQDQFDKLRGSDIATRIVQDMFNITQSCIRTRLNECVWYE